MRRTFWSFSYTLGTILAAVLIALDAWLISAIKFDELIGPLGLITVGLGLLLVAGLFFAAGRARVTVAVDDERARFSRLLRPTVTVSKQDTEFSISFGDDFDFAPGPKLVSDSHKSAWIRDAIHTVRRVISIGSDSFSFASSQRSPDEYFAAVKLQTNGSAHRVVLLPAITKPEQIADLVEALGATVIPPSE